VPLTHVVTGASGYTGRYIARRLLDLGHEVRSLTGHPYRQSPFGDRVAMLPYNFDDPDALARSLEGVDTLFNTYWIRLSYKDMTHERVVGQLRTLFGAAKAAGVRRVVHISITNATLDSPLPYFRGKAQVEEALRASGLSYAILKPTLIFGREDILINNIAWMLRKFPVFPIPGSGDYRLQPICVEDIADIAVEMSSGHENIELDAVGPDAFTYDEIVSLIGHKIGASSRLVHVPTPVALAAANLLGLLVRDIVLSRDEIEGLAGDLLASNSGEPPPGATRLSDWLDENAHRLGTSYSSELDRHYR
jgi:NADH dehydrogenase